MLETIPRGFWIHIVRLGPARGGIDSISDPNREATVETAVQVEAARIPDRDRLLAILQENGLDARPVDEVGLEVDCGEDAARTCEKLLPFVEELVLDLGAPFVPIKHDGVIYIRPPLS
jgi:hypothetical protein